jgi:hypothetical protein
MKSHRSLVGSCFVLVLSACAQRSPPATTITSASTSPSATATAREPGYAHELVIETAGCWLGGLWSDAVGDDRGAREGAIQRRCVQVLQAVGESPATAYYPLRAVDSATVEKVAVQVGERARDDVGARPHATDLLAFFREVANASRETIDARRAADSVKQAYDSSASVSVRERRADKIAAAPQLRSSAALRALLQHRGPYAREARVIGVLHAIDRMEIARGLPKHLKIYVVEGAGLELFGVTAPHFTSDAAAPIPTGRWLAYLESIASAAGHPVPVEAKDPQNREPLAWNGVLEGLADQLRYARTDTALDTVARDVVRRLDQQAKAERAAFEAHPRAAR